MSQQVTTTKGGIRVEDITFRGARRQSEIDKELNVLPEEKQEIKAPVSLTPEQVKLYYLTCIQHTEDQSTKKVYYQTIKWIDELQKVKSKLMQYELKEMKANAGSTTPDDIQE